MTRQHLPPPPRQQRRRSKRSAATRGASGPMHARPWGGRKLPDCRMVFNGEAMRQVVRIQREPDDFFRTWVHESLHARQPFAPGAAEQYLRYAGYEEGMVE